MINSINNSYNTNTMAVNNLILRNNKVSKVEREGVFLQDILIQRLP